MTTTTTTVGRDQVLAEIREAFGLVPSWVEDLPATGLSGFWALFRDFYLAETAIPSRYKELIGIAVSGATRCRYCVLFHTEGAKLHGATDEEVAEAALMGGVTMIGSTFLNAMGEDYDRFRDETLRIVRHVRSKQATPAATSAPGGRRDAPT